MAEAAYAAALVLAEQWADVEAVKEDVLEAQLDALAETALARRALHVAAGSAVQCAAC